MIKALDVDLGQRVIARLKRKPKQSLAFSDNRDGDDDPGSDDEGYQGVEILHKAFTPLCAGTYVKKVGTHDYTLYVLGYGLKSDPITSGRKFLSSIKAEFDAYTSPTDEGNAAVYKALKSPNGQHKMFVVEVQEDETDQMQKFHITVAFFEHSALLTATAKLY